MSDTVCIPVAILEDLRFRDLPPTCRAALPYLLLRFQQYGDGALTDKQIRTELLGPKRFALLADSLREWGYLARSPQGNLVRLGALAPLPSEEVYPHSADASRKQVARLGQQLEQRIEQKFDGLARALEKTLGLAQTGQNGGQTGLENRTNEAENLDIRPYKNGHAAPESAPNVPKAPDAGDSSTRLESSLESKHIYASSPSLDPSLASGENTQPAPVLTAVDGLPAPSVTAKSIFAELLELGFNVKQAEEALRNKTPEQISAGIDCLHKGYFKRNKKDVTTLLSYTQKKLPLDQEYEKKFMQQSAPMVSAVSGGTSAPPVKAAAPPTAAEEADNLQAMKSALTQAKQRTALRQA